MEKFEVTILGCGSAKPTLRHYPSAQVVNVREKLFMVDCGEGTQVQVCRYGINFNHISTLLISHLHGDHCYGLLGLASTLSLLGRTNPLHIYAHPDLRRILAPQLEFYAHNISFPLTFHDIDPYAATCIYDDRSLSIHTLPLNHRVPCCGFLFREKPTLPHIRRDMIDFYHIPYYAINTIKQGAGWELPDGTLIPHERLTFPSYAPRSYAYCSDTAFHEPLVSALRGVDLLYHEATYTDDMAPLANARGHSTARQAAELARRAEVKRLIIGHFSSRYRDERPLLEEAQAVFPSTILANEGLRLAVGGESES